MTERDRGRIAGLPGRLGWRRLSLRSRIALMSAIAVAVAVVAVSAVLFVVVATQLRHQLDQQLRSDAHTVAERPGDRWGAGSDPDRDHDHDLGPRVQVLDESGRPALATDVSPPLPVTPTAMTVVNGERAEGFENVHIDGEEYRMLTIAAEHGGTVQVAASTDGVERPLARIGLILVAVSTCGVTIATVLGFLVARTGLAPVHRLTRAVEHVAATNDLSSRITVSGQDEIARLAQAFNAMLAALQSSRAAQRLLVEDAGHELRTPLTSLRANIELLIRTDEQAGTNRVLTAEDRAALLRDLDAQTGELTQLVGELVELAREETGAEPVERVDLADLLELSTERIRQRWPQVRFATELDPVAVPGRPASLERMVINLLDNAAKWSPEQSPVRVRLRAVARPLDDEPADSRRWAELTISDSGPGIDEADLPLIFERFYRATAARAMPGSGLGLAIVAQAVELHDGTVTAGRSETGGAVFTVRLPALDANQSLSSVS
ncbi:ATP-binding protein [Micromonospora sp. RHAY321]|uniref:HAMP domain-containing sensor histidine kinase n=1 Tax=Micromonospora sp. RHAY321 TaxID=2944807 RepID=UPI00207D6963|nr:ATP-binding protein [Micromonospora sp. RHAY321]MCO1593890.1 ATP-binding protein [Micromonospora sp. RHAY321]